MLPFCSTCCLQIFLLSSPVPSLTFYLQAFLRAIKKADRFLISTCLCIGYSLFGSSSLSAKGKRRFYICVLVQRKIAVWVAKKPDIIGLFAGDIFFVSTLWSEWGDLNPRPLGPEPSALPAALHPVFHSLLIIWIFLPDVKCFAGSRGRKMRWGLFAPREVL